MIGASVGQGGVNAASDVMAIQALLNAKIDAGLTVDGACGPKTIAAIVAFQGNVAGVAVADGLISPDGPAYAALTAAGVAASPAALQPDTPPPVSIILDLSDNNSDTPPVDFGALKNAGVAAVILKATEGATWQDPTFKARLGRAQAAGLLVGAYHYGTAMPVPDQIRNFTTTVKAAGGDFTTVLAALDVEKKTGSTNIISLAQADAWVAGFTAQTGARPMAYGGADYLGGANAGLANLIGSPLWQAEYPDDTAVRPAPLTAWSKWTLWQFTDGTQGCYGGALAGLRCDRSIFLGDAAALAVFWRGQLGA